MAVHAVGARVVELLFSTFPAKHTHVLRQEFYGPHFSLFTDVVLATNSPKTTPTLQSNIELHPNKKEAACDFVNNLIQKGLDKGLYGFAFFQQLVSEYIAVVGHDKDLISNLVDHSLHMLSTRAGTQVVIYCTAYGTAKDRKRILKAVKGYTRSSLLHRDAYLAILQIVLVTDDTVSVHKSLLAELLTVDPEKKVSEDNQNHPLLEIALHDQASKLLLLLVAPSDSDNTANDDKEDKGIARTPPASYSKFLDPLEQTVLQRNPTVMEPGSGVEVPTCKKNPSTRRKELLQYMIKPLEHLCLQHTNQLARSLAGSRVLQQVYMNVSSSDELRETLVQLCCPKTSGSKNKDKEQASLLDDPVGHYLAKHLVAANPDFAHSLAKAMDFDRMISSSRAAFVVVALCKTPERKAVLQRIPKSKLLAAMKRLKSKVEHEDDDDNKNNKVATMAGFEALLKEVNGGE
jgi:pumilio family protein 6